MPSLIGSFVEKCQNGRPPVVDVVGDSMIDEYYQVSVSRISPEFKIPVMLAGDDEPSVVMPGGAANVCHQLSRLGGVKSRLVSMLGPSTALSFQEDHKIDVSHCQWDHRLQIPTKRRYYDQDFPFSRYDIERPNYGMPNHDLELLRQELFRRYREGDQGDVLILSDYDKGFFGLDFHSQDWVGLGRTTIVDPKHGPAEKWRGCTVFKPNSSEAFNLTGLPHWKDQIRDLEARLECRHVVITQGDSGVVGWDEDLGNFFEYRNPAKQPARSVIGAGDCFAAFLAVAIHHGFTVKDAAEIAFLAGAAYVKNIHNHPISLYDLLKSEDPLAAKFMPPQVENGEKLVMTNGVYDIIHQGHTDLLRFAKSKGDKLVVALNSDASVRRLKGPTRPVVPLSQRMAVVAAMESVDFVCSFDEDTPLELIRKILPSAIVKGGDYRKEEVVGHNLVEDVFLFDYMAGQSTTSIIQACQSVRNN